MPGRDGGLGGRNLRGDASGEFFHVGAAERGDGDFLLRAVNRHRLQRRLLGQRVHDGTREASLRLASCGAVSVGGDDIHDQLIM